MIRELRALLWKDYRVHRPVLILGGLLVLVPYLGGLLGALLAPGPFAASWPRAAAVAGMSLGSLFLTMGTMTVLAGSAFATERQDRSSEFLACLPTSRRMQLASKIAVTVGASLLMWLVNLIILFAVAPKLHAAAEIERALTDGSITVMSQLVPVGVLLFGAAWLASAELRQPVLATACGLAAPVIVAVGVKGLDLTLDPATFAYDPGYRTACLTLGIASFLAGCAGYLRRFEP